MIFSLLATVSLKNKQTNKKTIKQTNKKPVPSRTLLVLQKNMTFDDVTLDRKLDEFFFSVFWHFIDKTINLIRKIISR